MVDGRNSAGFTLESLTYLRQRARGIGQNLDRDHPVQPDISGFVDLAHATRPGGCQNFVRTKTSAGAQDHTV